MRRRRRRDEPVVEHYYDPTATIHPRWLDTGWWRLLERLTRWTGAS